MSLAGRSPCFAMCGDDICRDHGCRHVYKQRLQPLKPLNYAEDAHVDEVPLNWVLPAPLAEVWLVQLEKDQRG
jgi:hypothetical protein